MTVVITSCVTPSNILFNMQKKQETVPDSRANQRGNCRSIYYVDSSIDKEKENLVDIIQVSLPVLHYAN